MDRKFSIRTILIATFLFIAFLTPVFAFVSYDMVQETGEQSEKVIENAIAVTNLSQDSVHYSQQIVYNFENIRDYQQESDQAAAENEADELVNNFEEFVNITNQLIDYMEESEEDFEEEKARIRDAQEGMQSLIQQNLAYVDQGVTLGSVVIEDSRSQLDSISQTSTDVSTQVVNTETRELLVLNENLENLSVAIMAAGGVTVFLGVAFALGISILVSRPVKKLELEAEKIKREEFEEVNLERINTRIIEFDELKNMIENVVIALKSEFDRDRKGMNDLALDLVSILSEDVPRGVAESSVSSAAEKAGVSLVEMTSDDAEEIISNLKVSTRGLGVSEETFEKMNERIE